MAEMRGSGAGRARWARLTESVESRLWPLPVAAILLAVVLGLVLPRIDLLIDAELPTAVDSVIFNGGAETARSVLSSIAGSLITATSLTFSLTVVALQLASSQASPRVLRLFARDRQVHATLAVFLGTFAYSITVLRSVRATTDDAAEFVPRVAVTTAFVLTLVSVIMLVFFLAHLAAQLRVETMLKDIHAETNRTIDLVGAGNEAAQAYTSPMQIPVGTHTVTAAVSGFITGRDHAALVAYAAPHSLVFQEVRRVGENVVAGTPLMVWWPAGDGTDPADADDVADAVRGAYSIAYERTAAQDIDYGVQQIVDIGVRALSPGINDPTTAVNALGHLSAIVASTLQMPALPSALADADGNLRVVTATRTAADTIHDALSPMRHYGANDPSVVRRFLQLVSDLAYTCSAGEVQTALQQQLAALDLQLQAQGDDPASVREMRAAVAEVTARIADSPVRAT
ncbi:DUF2254 domain-containing protein [Cryobacterium sp. TMB1-7]|nr:DUF2254 domain-containing protein [Cryobacterium sp. TMB1-7]